MMKFLLLFAIRSYWFLIPESKRRQCIFRKSCSNFVYEETFKNGLLKGLSALKFRYQNCASGFIIFDNPIDGKKMMSLPNQQIIQENEIAKRFL